MSHTSLCGYQLRYLCATVLAMKCCKCIMMVFRSIFGLVINLTPYKNTFCLAIGCPFEWCTAHTTCPPGKYTSKPGSSTAQPTCETCAPGFFKASASKSSTRVKVDSGIRKRLLQPHGDHEDIPMSVPQEIDDFVKFQN